MDVDDEVTMEMDLMGLDLNQEPTKTNRSLHRVDRYGSLLNELETTHDRIEVRIRQNLKVMSVYGTTTTLTSLHLMVTYFSLHVALHLNLFKNKPIDINTVVLFRLLNGVSIELLDISLGLNSIGFYQMTKLEIIHFTVILETLFLKKQFSKKIKISIIALLVGVGIASVTNIQLNFVGTILSLLAIITTCIAQIVYF